MLAGCLGSDDDAGGETETDDESGSELHERYGYSSTSMDEEPPVEPDHEVDLLMNPPAEEEMPPEFYFEPAGLAIETGDVVQFNFLTLDHSVATFHEEFGRSPRTPEDAEPLSSPMMATETYWLCPFEEAGVYDLYCPPHEDHGMGMRIVADEATGPATEPADPDNYVPGEQLPPQGKLLDTFNSAALDAERILEEGSVPWEDVHDSEQ